MTSERDTHYCQPIFEVSGAEVRLYAVEYIAPGTIATLESLQIAFEQATLLTPAVPVHVKIDAATAARDAGLVARMSELAEHYGIDPRRIIVEITGYRPAVDGSPFRLALRSMKLGGFGLCIDDIGAAEHMKYRMISDCTPDYLKIEGHLTAAIHRQPSHQRIVNSILRMARDLGSRVIAAQIDSGPDFAIVHQLGVDLMQGDLLAPPLTVALFAEVTS